MTQPVDAGDGQARAGMSRREGLKLTAASTDAGLIPFNPNATGASHARQHRDPFVPGQLS